MLTDTLWLTNCFFEYGEIKLSVLYDGDFIIWDSEIDINFKLKYLIIMKNYIYSY